MTVLPDTYLYRGVFSGNERLRKLVRKLFRFVGTSYLRLRWSLTFALGHAQTLRQCVTETCWSDQGWNALRRQQGLERQAASCAV